MYGASGELVAPHRLTSARPTTDFRAISRLLAPNLDLLVAEVGVEPTRRVNFARF